MCFCIVLEGDGGLLADVGVERMGLKRHVEVFLAEKHGGCARSVSLVACDDDIAFVGTLEDDDGHTVSLLARHVSLHPAAWHHKMREMFYGIELWREANRLIR